MYNLEIPFNIIHMELHLKRKLFYYLLNVYLPSTFLITVSYSSLYLTPTSKVPRIGMCLMTLLSVTTTINDVKNTMPRVTYITMADAWLFPIIYYSFLCLFQFFIIQYLVELEMELTAKKVECAASVLFPSSLCCGLQCMVALLTSWDTRLMLRADRLLEGVAGWPVLVI